MLAALAASQPIVHQIEPSMMDYGSWHTPYWTTRMALRTITATGMFAYEIVVYRRKRET
jgi:hypothetical protein